MRKMSRYSIIFYILVFLAGQVSLEGVYPLAVGLAAAGYAEGFNIAAITITVICSLLVSLGFSAGMKYIVIILASLTCVIVMKRKQNYVNNTRLGAMLLIISVIVSVINNADNRFYEFKLIFSIFEAIVIVSSMMVFRRGIAYVKSDSTHGQASTEEAISLSMLVTTALAGGFSVLGGRLSMISVMGLYLISLIIVVILNSRQGTIDEKERFTDRSYARLADEQLYAYAESIGRLSKALYSSVEKRYEISEEEQNRILDSVLDRHCTWCERCDYCWNHNFSTAYGGAKAMISSSSVNGYIRYEDVPDEFIGLCMCSEGLVNDTNIGLETARINIRWNNKMIEARRAMAKQFHEMSEVIHNFSKHLYNTASIDKKSKKRIITRLRYEQVIVSEVCCFCDSRDKLVVIINAKAVNGERVTVKETALILSEIFEKSLVPQKGERLRIPMNYDNISFVEDTKYSVITGNAFSSKDDVTGDNYAVVNNESAEAVLILSDGMGFGEKAYKDSEDIVEVLEDFFDAGFEREAAIRLLNSVMMLKSEENTLDTVDMCIIDKDTGECEFIKIGAAASFIRHRDSVEIISSGSLPMGIFEAVDYETAKSRVCDGEFIILVTDGVIDCMSGDNKEEQIADIISNIDSNNPSTIAQRLLQIAKDMNEGDTEDDMTVIIAGLWKK